MALTLPLELQQQVFQYLDPRSFYASRNVCRWWKHASRDAVTLANQLGQLPIEPQTWAKKADSPTRQSAYDKAARALMLGMRVTAQVSADEHVSNKINKPKVALSSDGTRAVSLHDRVITSYDLTTRECAVVSQRPINDLRTAIGGGPWFKCAATSMYELALSSDGSLLAVALERTIQVYDLTADNDSWPVSSYIPSATGHYIAGLDFEHHDSLLRVRLSNKGAVVYLGSPRDSKADLEHWQEKGGLRHAFLDASRLAMPISKAEPAERQRFVGLQLLRQYAHGWLFAAQKHAIIGHSSSYCLGYVACSQIHGHVLTAERRVVLLQDLAVGLPDNVRHLWHDLPSAHVHHPRFAMSPDGSLLAISEEIVGRSESPFSSRVFLYRLPSTKSIAATLESPSEPEINPDYRIQRLPLSLDAVSGKVFKFGFETTLDSDRSYAIKAVTDNGAITFKLLDS